MELSNKITEALERLIRWNTHKEFYSVSLSFKIGILDEYRHQDDFLIPHMRIQAITDEQDELTDICLSFRLLFDGVDASKSQQVYQEIKNSRFGFLFGTRSGSKYHLKASLGKNVKMASSMILYFLRLFSKSKEIELKPLYYCPMVLEGEMSNLKRNNEIMPSQSIKNLMDTLFDRTRTIGSSLHFDVLKYLREDSELLAEVVINKWHEGEGYTAWIRTEEINLHFLDAMFKRFVDYSNKDCAKEFNIQDNSLDIRVEFKEDQIEELIYFISDCLKMFYPSLILEKSIAQAKYNYFNPVAHIYLPFYPDGRKPSEKELECVFQLINNCEYFMEEDDYFETDNK